MPAKIVVGAQWGDEGKGKIIDILAGRADVVVRSQGGNNAGHTVEHAGDVYKLQLIPSGILYPDKLCLLGAGVVVNPKSILEEIDNLRKRGISCDNLRIDPRCHIIMPWHIQLDALSEEGRGEQDIGTTRRGIGPCYMDKTERSGIRMYDLIHPELFSKKALAAAQAKNLIITRIYGGEPIDAQAVIDQYTRCGERLKPHVADVSLLTHQACVSGKSVLFEGAQGTLLDLDFGTYPFVTSSHPVAGGACIGSGVGPTIIDDIVGVAKAYTTRVGKGPFPTELHDATGDLIRERGHEFGTVTGRARRTGWFDAVILRHSVRVNGITGLSINKLDTLSGVGKLKICVAYKKTDGSVITEFPPTIDELAECSPVYEELPGYDGDLSGVQSFDGLPGACKNYIKRIEDLCGCPVIMAGVGPARDQNLER